MSERSVNASGNIERSVIVTGDGNRVSLSFGSAFILPLDRRQIPVPRRRKAIHYDPLPLLAPDADKLPLVGRDAILSDLRAWVDGDDDVSVQALIARAGTGKTRLAIELCKAIDGAPEPGASGWLAGFVRPSDLASAVEGLATRSFDWPHPTLLVIDYAAAGHREIARWLDRLVGETFDGRLRLLLLDREAPPGFGWWHDLTHPTENRSVTRTDLFVDPDRPFALADLDQNEARRVLLEATFNAAITMLGNAGRHRLPPAGSGTAFDTAIAGPRFGNPLNLAMAGLIAAERGPIAAISLRRLDAARHLARHELGRMEQIARGESIDTETMRHVLGFNGLAGGLVLATLREDLVSECARAALAAPSPRLADVLMRELAWSGRGDDAASEPRLDTIQPDLIGEAVIVEALLMGAPDRATHATKIVERAYALTGPRAAEALMRLIQDYGHATEDPGASDDERVAAQIVLGLLAALAEAIPDEEVERLETLVFAFPKNTIVLREIAAEQTRRLVMIWRMAADPQGDESARNRTALWLNTLASRLSALGQREQALEAAREAVDLYRTLAAARPDTFTPNLAISLNNLANRLSALGQREAALEAAQEAVDLHRTLAAARPDAFTPDLAMSLNNLASFLSDLGQREPALEAAQEAAGLYRTLAAARADAFTPDLAVSLNTLASRLSALGQREAALEAAQEAVDLHRTLAAARPDAFTPDLAMSLNNLASFLSDLGQREPALEAAQEVVDLYRTLAAARPDAFTPDLAGSLNNLANRLSDLGQPEPALEAAQEAVDLYRTLAAARPDAFLPDVAMSLNTLANRLSALGQHEAAREAAQEAVDLYRALAAARPEAFTPNLAMSLNNLANRLSDLGQNEAALGAAQEAVDLYRALAAARPDAFTPDLAGSLNNLAYRLNDLGQRETALEAAQEAVDLYCTLAAARPDAFTPNLATSLSVLGDQLEEVGRREEAVAADRQSIDALSPYFLSRPAVFVGPMTTYIRDYLRRAEAAGIEVDEALMEPILAILVPMLKGAKE